MSPRAIYLTVGVPALALATASAVSTGVSNYETRPWLWGPLSVVSGLAFCASGLIAWIRRPENGTGRLLALVGLTFLGLSSLWEANSPLLSSLGSALGAMYLAVFVHLLVAYPHGQVRARLERGFVAAVYAIAFLASLIPELFIRKLDCNTDTCPRNVFLVSDRHRLGHVFEAGGSVLGVALFLGLFVALVRRWRVASPAARRQLSPVYLSGATVLVLVGVGLGSRFASHLASDVAWISALVAFIALPFLFVGGLLRGRLARVDAARVLLETPDEPSLEEVQASLRRALRDPTLELLEWADDERCYLDASGESHCELVEGNGRALTRIEYAGRPLAAIVHDVALQEEPELLAEVVATARLALEKDRGHRALQRSEARTRALLDAMPDLMIRFRRDGTYLDIRGNTSGLVAPAEEMIGSNVWDLLPLEVVEPLMQCAYRALDSGLTETVEYELDLPDGRHEFEARMVPSGADEIVSIVRDITEQRMLEQELRRSRARIVEAGDAERRRLERNLHDGAQQRLVSLSLALRLARGRLRTDADAAADILTRAGEELGLALEELRELARGIHPAVLTDRGLGAALEGLADRAPVPVELEAVPAERLPAPVEAAAFYVVSESLTNVAKYAQASLARVSVTRVNGRAFVEVVDDGVGGADPTRGSGLRGLTDRIEALDGLLLIESAPGSGTRVRAEIPCG